jgi:hypothetical protein
MKKTHYKDGNYLKRSGVKYNKVYKEEMSHNRITYNK